MKTRTVTSQGRVGRRRGQSHYRGREWDEDTDSHITGESGMKTRTVTSQGESGMKTLTVTSQGESGMKTRTVTSQGGEWDEDADSHITGGRVG